MTCRLCLPGCGQQQWHALLPFYAHQLACDGAAPKPPLLPCHTQWQSMAGTLRNVTRGYCSDSSLAVASSRSSPRATSTTFRPCPASLRAMDLPMPGRGRVKEGKGGGTQLVAAAAAAAAAARLFAARSALTAAGSGDQRPLRIVCLLQVLGFVEPGDDEVRDGVGQVNKGQRPNGQRSQHRGKCVQCAIGRKRAAGAWVPAVKRRGVLQRCCVIQATENGSQVSDVCRGACLCTWAPGDMMQRSGSEKGAPHPIDSICIS